MSQSDTEYRNQTNSTWRCSMDKISSIISSSRKHVDMSKERPVRAGAPSYGQPVSPATHTFGEEQKAEQVKRGELAMFPTARMQAEEAKMSSPDVFRHTGIIDKITLSFKGNSERPEESETVDVVPEHLSNPSLVEGESRANETPAVDIYA